MRSGLSAGVIITSTGSDLSRALVVAPAAPGRGGQGSAGASMLSGLQAQGVSCSYVGPPDRAGALAKLAANRPLRRWPSFSRAIARQAVLRQVPSDWDLVYAMPGFVPLRGPGIKVLHQATHHPRRVVWAVDAAAHRAGGGRGFMTLGEARALERELQASDLIRTESLAVARELVQCGIAPERVIHSYPGVDCDRFRPLHHYDDLTVAFVGVLSLWKGVDILARLAHTLHGRAITAVIGGPVCPWSRRLTIAAPFTFHVDVPDLLGRAHALVLPAASDGFGYVVLEAMAAGTVPFVSPETGAAEIVSRLDARLVQPREKFAEIVPELLESLPLSDLGERARLIAQEFRWQEMSEVAAARILDAARQL